MLSVCMFRGGGVLFCALAHALFNYGGNLVTPARGLGFGSFADIWCPAEVVLTVVVGVCAIAYFIWLLYVSPPDAADRFAVFPPEKEEPPQAPAPSDGEAPPQHPADAGEGSDGNPPAR